MVKLAALIVGLAIAGSLVWIGGEQHRENCIREGRVECSVLPWEDGKPKPRKPTIWDDRNPF